MITTLANIPHHFIQLLNSPSFSHAITNALRLTKKISYLVTPYYNGGSAAFFGSQGSYELFQAIQKQNANTVSQLIAPTHYYPLHGSLLVGYALCSTSLALHGFKVIQLGTWVKPLQAFGGACFLLASLLELQKNILRFNTLREKEKSGPIENQKAHDGQKKAALFGIISNAGYILSTVLTIFGISLGLALFVGVISAFLGLLNFLYDYTVREQKKSERIV